MISSPNIPYRWRLVIIVLVACFVIYHVGWMTLRSPTDIHLTNPSHDSPTEDTLSDTTGKTLEFELQFPLQGIQGFHSRLPPIQFDFASKQPSSREEAIRKRRQAAVKESFLHAWRGYKKYAMGHDEIRPLTKAYKDPFGGWGATMVDALSTLLVMELDSEFEAVLSELEKIDFVINKRISVFETIIRYLGGFLGAYELSQQKHPILLEKAEELTKVLMPAFDTPFGLPYHEWNPVTNYAINNRTVVAEVGSLQLEFMLLSHHTGDDVYAKKAHAIFDYLDNMKYEHGVYIKGLYPATLDIGQGRFVDTTCTFGAMGDSLYEYFLKMYILTEGTVPQYGHMYKDSIDNMKFRMLQQLPGTQFLFLPPFDTSKTQPPKDSMDHLTCFVPGMLAIGSVVFDRPEDMMIAKGLLETCVYMYRSSATGLSPENWRFAGTVSYNPMTYRMSQDEMQQARQWWYKNEEPPAPAYETMAMSATGPVNATNEEDKSRLAFGVDTSSTLPPAPLPRPAGLKAIDTRYYLRPETLESIFILYRITGDPKYQEYGWEIYEAIEKWCKTEAAYAVVSHVEKTMESPSNNQEDTMESFLLAETFKYLYLLFSPPDVISLDKFVFNTEAHPLMRRPVV